MEVTISIITCFSGNYTIFTVLRTLNGVTFPALFQIPFILCKLRIFGFYNFVLIKLVLRWYYWLFQKTRALVVFSPGSNPFFEIKDTPSFLWNKYYKSAPTLLNTLMAHEFAVPWDTGNTPTYKYTYLCCLSERSNFSLAVAAVWLRHLKLWKW